jgi:hypothetical protein
MIDHILSEEEEHASDLSDLLFIADPRTGETEGEDPGTHALDIPAGNEKSRQQSGQPKPSKNVPSGKREPAKVEVNKSSKGNDKGGGKNRS